MEKQLLYHSTAKEVCVFADNFLKYFQRYYSKEEGLLRLNVDELAAENDLLEKVAYRSRKRKYTTDLRRLNARVNQCFISLKLFVKANIHFPDTDARKQAKEVWNLIERYDSTLNRKSLEARLIGFRGLLDCLNSNDYKAHAEQLTGLPNCVKELAQLLGDLEAMLSKSNNYEAKNKPEVEATAHAHKMKKIINDKILPLLNVMYGMDEQKYKSLYDKTQKSLKGINDSVRHRRRLWGKRDGE